MTSPAQSAVQNLLPVQAYFDAQDNFVEFIGQNKPFYAVPDPNQSGLNITNSTINSTTIGATTPSTAVFSSAQVIATPTSPLDITNKQYVDYLAAGLSWKAPVNAATTVAGGNITLSGLQTIDTVVLAANETVLVKNQTNAAENGIYTVKSGAWTRTIGADTWDEFIGAIVFVVEGTQTGTAWYCTAQPGGTLGVTAIDWSNFSVASSYTAGTGLQLIGTQFSIANTAVTAAAYGSSTQVGTFTVNAQGQLTLAGNTTITPAVGSITGLGTGVATALGVNTGSAGAFVVNGGAIGTPTSGDFSSGTFTWPTFNQNTTGTAANANNLVGGATGSVPYQSATNTTTFLAAGSNGQVLTLASGVPSWATPTTGTVTSVSGAGTVNGLTLTGTVTTSGSLTLGGTLDLSSPPAIGGTTASTIRGTTITATTSFVGTHFDASGSGGGSLRTNTGNACLQWGGGGGTNVTIDGPINMNGANSAISLAPTGTGTVTINPATASTMNNVAIGGTTPLAGTFTDFRVNNTISLNGSTGTANYLLQSNGASAPSWVNPTTLTVSAASTATTATNATNTAITDDTTTNATMYPTWVTTTTGNLPQKTSSTKLSFNPSTGVLSATTFSGSGASLTSVPVNQATGILPEANGGTGTTTGYYGFKNRIINGAMVIDQRNAGASVTPTNGQYTLDRWGAYAFGSATSKFTVQQSSTAPAGFKNSLQVTSTSAYSVASGDITAVYQIIEGYNVADLDFGTANAKTITISFWVRSSLTGAFGGSIKNGGSNRAYPFTYTISSANTWEQKSVTIAGDTSGTWLATNGQGLFVIFGLGVGSTYSGTASAWASSDLYSATGATSVVGTNGATFYITGVQLEVGFNATSFDRRPYGTELQLCQRYYEKSYAQGTVPGTATSYPVIGMSFNGMSNTSGQKYVISTFKVTKRASPTMTYYDIAGTSGKISTLDISGANTNNVNIALSFVNDSLYGAAPSNGTHTGITYDWTASIEL
jgi:hypothetical protein